MCFPLNYKKGPDNGEWNIAYIHRWKNKHEKIYIFNAIIKMFFIFLCPKNIRYGKIS